MTTREYEKLQRDLATAKTEVAQAEGALTQLRAELKSKFGCSSGKEAAALLKTQTAEVNRLETQLTKGLAAFDRKWKTPTD